MNAQLRALIEPYTGRFALFDSNVLLLYLVAEFRPEMVGAQYKRLALFDRHDAQLIAWLANCFRSVITLPHVLTEVSNLSNQMPAYMKEAWLPWFGQRLAKLQEETLASREVSTSEAFHNFGLTDACIAHLAGSYVVVTSDYPLSGSLQAKGLPVINFNHLRQSWLTI